jgi:hypothetical protein
MDAHPLKAKRATTEKSPASLIFIVRSAARNPVFQKLIPANGSSALPAMAVTRIT